MGIEYVNDPASGKVVRVLVDGVAVPGPDSDGVDPRYAAALRAVLRDFGERRDSEGRAKIATDPGLVIDITPPRPRPGRNWPEHDRSAPAYQLAAHGLDPATYFVGFEAEHPMIVENATGKPVGRVVGGKLEWADGPRPAWHGPWWSRASAALGSARHRVLRRIFPDR